MHISGPIMENGLPPTEEEYQAMVRAIEAGLTDLLPPGEPVEVPLSEIDWDDLDEDLKRQLNNQS